MDDDNDAGRAALTRAPLRVMQVIAALAGSEGGLSLAQLSERVGVPKSSLFSLLRSLQAGGYIESTNGHHQLGQEAFNLASVISRGRSFPANLRPMLSRLCQQCGETVMLAAPGDAWNDFVYLDVAESDAWLRFKVDFGARRPLYSTAPGLALLAFAPSEARARYIKSVQLKPFTPETVSTRKALINLLEKTRADGVVLSSASHEGVTAIGAPVFNTSGEVVAAVALAGLSTRIQRDQAKLCTEVRRAGEQMSRLLGLTGPYPGSAPGH